MMKLRTLTAAILTSSVPLALAVLSSASSSARAQSITPQYSSVYTLTDIGSVPGLPDRYGGLTFKPKEPDVLIIGGTANEAGGQIYAIAVERGPGRHITGFTGTAAVFSEGQFNDGGVTFGPADVLFLTRYPSNELAQVKENSVVVDKVIDLAPFNIVSSPGGLTFVPPEHPNVNAMKMTSWPTGEWYDVVLAPDANGTFDIVSATEETVLPGGPEGFVFVPPGSDLFPGFSLLVSEYSANEIAAYELDADSNPIVATRTTFLTGLDGAEGAVTDPLTGDYLFSTFGGGSRVIVVQGFSLPQGAPCTDAGDCATGFCAGGFCCNEACNGSCETCALAGGADADGVCAPLAAGTTCDDDDACRAAGTCDADGNCSSAPLDCAPSDACHEVTGCDPVVGCEEVARVDGVACGAGFICIAGDCVADGAGEGEGEGDAGEGEGEGDDGQPVNGCGCASSSSESALAVVLLGALALARRRRLFTP